MVKNIITISAAALLFLSSCVKDETKVSSTAAESSVSLTNANGSSKTVNFFIDGAQKTLVSAVGANGTVLGTYVGLGNGGSHTISVKDATVTTTEYFNASVAVDPAKAYTFIVYDTLISGKFKGLLLSSDRTIAVNNTATAQVRYLNLSPKSPSMDLWMVRRVGAVNTDSINIGAMPYLGSVATPNTTTLSTFTTVRASEVAGSAGVGVGASDYIIRLKLTGTSTIISSTAVTNIIPSRNYTIFARGIYPASAVTLLLNN